METIRLIVYLVFGFIFGSFGNVLIYRVPRNMSIVTPPSSCPKCGEIIKWYDNIPIFSYIFLRGRCRHCGSKINLRYLLVELMSGILFFSAAVSFRNNIEAIACSFFFFILLIVSIIDLEHMIIPDKISLNFFAVSLLLSGIGNLSQNSFIPLIGKPGFIHSIEGSIYLTAAFVLIEIMSRKIFKKEGVGMGDIKLGLSIGLYLGPYSLFSLFLAYLIGAPLGFYLKYKMKSEYIPFGPFLALSSILTVFFGERILNWYFSLVGI